MKYESGEEIQAGDEIRMMVGSRPWRVTSPVETLPSAPDMIYIHVEDPETGEADWLWSQKAVLIRRAVSTETP